MLDIIFIIFTSIYLLVISYITGLFINRYFDFPAILNFPLGYFTLLGTSEIIIYSIVFFHLPAEFFFQFMWFISFLVLLLFSIYNKKLELKFKLNITTLVLLSIYVLTMIYISASRSIAEESFDTVFYLSSYLESAFSKTFSSTNEYLGLPRSGISPLDDYQSFYYVGAWILNTYSIIQKLVNESFYPIVIHVQIWISSIIYFVMNFSFTIGIVQIIQAKNKYAKYLSALFVLFFISNFYYNNVFTFYGNTYRTLVVGFMSFIIYQSLQNRQKLFQYFVLLGITSSALISASASGFFIGFIMIYAYVTLLFVRNYIDEKNIFGLLFVIFPTLQFIVTYFFNGSTLQYLIAYGSIFILYSLFYLLLKITNRSLIKILKIIIVYLIPIFIFFMSLRLIMSGYFNPMSFFNKHSLGDMMWDYFDFNSFKYAIVNTLYLVSLILMFIKSKHEFRLYLFILIMVFINPISQAFISKYLAAHIYYRSYETLFNNFNIMFILVLLIDLIISRFNHTKYIFSLIILSLSIHQATFYYHFHFIPESEDYSVLYKLEKNKVDVFNMLNTKIILEGYERANVVSQIEAVKGYVPKIRTFYSYSYYYPLDYDNKALQNIFIYRDYFGQDYFGVEPDYANTCNLLIENKVDFIIVAKNQSYWLDGHYEPLFIRVRECAKDVYDNDEYILYQMYWK